MGKAIVIVLATCSALWLAFYLIGPRIEATAFNLPHFGHPVSWMMVCGVAVGFVIWRTVKGK